MTVAVAVFVVLETPAPKRLTAAELLMEPVAPVLTLAKNQTWPLASLALPGTFQPKAEPLLEETTGEPGPIWTKVKLAGKVSVIVAPAELFTKS